MVVPMVEIFWVKSKVFAFIRAAACEASHPACPPPITITSYSGSTRTLVNFRREAEALDFELPHRLERDNADVRVNRDNMVNPLSRYAKPWSLERARQART
jgi:hypothetical protein